MIDSCTHWLKCISNYEHEYLPKVVSSWYFGRSNVITEEGGGDDDTGGLVSWPGIGCLLIGYILLNTN